MVKEIFLVIEASTSEPSIALIQSGRVDGDDEVSTSAVIASAILHTRDPITGARSEPLAPEVQKLFQDSDVTPDQLSGVVCASGPGGFTSLRGAAAVAKGMCSSLSIPLYSVPTPVLLVASIQLHEHDRYVVAQDAGRNESYVSVVEIMGEPKGGHTLPRVVGDVSIVSNELLQEFSSNVNGFLLNSNESSAPHTSSAVGNSDLEGNLSEDNLSAVQPVNIAACASRLMPSILSDGVVDLNAWEPTYGRLAEAQVKWEAQHGRKLPV